MHGVALQRKKSLAAESTRFRSGTLEDDSATSACLFTLRFSQNMRNNHLKDAVRTRQACGGCLKSGSSWGPERGAEGIRAIITRESSHLKKHQRDSRADRGSLEMVLRR